MLKLISLLVKDGWKKKCKNSDINTEESSSHSNLTLSEEEMEVIKSNVIKSKMAVLLEILQELVPLTIEKSEA